MARKRKQNYRTTRQKEKVRKRQKKAIEQEEELKEIGKMLFENSNNNETDNNVDNEQTNSCISVDNGSSSRLNAVFGNFHQGCNMFSEESRGRQCTCISLTMLAKRQDSMQLTSEFIDSTLIEGDSLYRTVIKNLHNSGQFNDNYLLFNELPTVLSINGTRYHVTKLDTITGVVLHNNDSECYSLEDGLRNWAEYADSGLILVNGFCSAMFRFMNQFWYFDSHSHSENGMSSANGKAILVHFDSIVNLISFLYQYYASINSLRTVQYEILPVRIENTMQQSCRNETLINEPLQESYNSCLELDNYSKRLKTMREKYKQKYRNNETFRHKKKMYERGRYISGKKLKQQINEDFHKTESKGKYKTDKDFQERKKAKSKEKYQSDKEFQERKKTRSKEKYQSDKHFQKSVKTRSKEKYRNDKDFQESVKARSKEKYQSDKEFQERKKTRSKEKYQSDKHFQESVKTRSKEKYRNDKDFQESVKARMKEKYQSDKEFQESVKTRSKQKYQNNKEFQESVKTRSKKKYQNDKEFQESVKTASKEKYRNDKDFQESVKTRSKEKYQRDNNFQEKVKAKSKNKYKTNQEIQRMKKTKFNEKYRENIDFRNKVKEKVTQRRKLDEKALKNSKHVITFFKKKITSGPDCICCVCHKLRFRRQVVVCKEDNYAKKCKKVASTAKQCITYTYLHQCSDTCDEECEQSKTPRSQLWICYTCHRTILNGKIPCDAYINNLQLEEIPEDLKKLNKLEKHLIALRIPFIKLVSLPKGGQYGISGPVTGVPCNIQHTTKVLPRCEEDSQLIQVKLKRKLPYKGHYQHQYISTRNVEVALKHLIRVNKWYSDVVIDSSWESFIQETVNDIGSDTENSYDLRTITTENKEDTDSEDTLCGNPLDTCLQPVDIGQEFLDQQFDKIFCVAPAEGKTPVRMLNEKGNEAMSFPTQYPSGNGSFSDEREIKISLQRYCQSRLLNADNRFSSDTGYIFYTQYLCELYKIISGVSIAMRKGNEHLTMTLTPDRLKDPEFLKDILKSDQGYKFLRPVRGTPPYWQGTLKDLFAMLRQLGIPTWFCSFSSADLRWKEIANTIYRQQGRDNTSADLTWTEKCELLRENPVTVAQMFDNRWHLFLKEVILSEANPIGKVIDYFYRIEFQMRGSPHVHALFWIKDAPSLDKDTDETVCSFISRYVTCELPPEDDDLNDIVRNVQTHSKTHSISCRKKGTECRFNFPRHPSSRVYISRSAETDPEQEMTKKEASEKLKQLWHIINTSDIQEMSTEQLLLSVGLTQDTLETAMNIIANKTTIYLKRQAKEVWVNNYNADLLRCWDGNMDIQYITDAYSCIMYVVSYISKTEREMGLILENARKEALENNTDAQMAMKKIGGAYLHQREISAQEAIYRVCGLKLKECSRNTTFIPVGENPVRMSKPLKLIQSSEETQNGVWMTSSIDRYKARPLLPNFEIMCLATFCSEYRVVYQAQLPVRMGRNIFELQNNLGFIQRRTKTKKAIIRYPRFSITKNREQYYHSLLQLYLPYRAERQLKPETFLTYSDFYNKGAVKLIPESEVQPVREIVEENKSIYDRYSDQIEDAEELFEKNGPQEDAWAQICSETEVERLECENMKSINENSRENDGDIPDLFSSGNSSLSQNTIEIHPNRLSREQIFSLLRTLNSKQRDIFYQIRTFCINLANGIKQKPFHVFVTGGAGTGKSHLIKSIYHECQRILAPTVRNPDDVSILILAPTGTAAFNVGGSTIHSALSIGRNMPIPCVPLSDDKINTLRSKLECLQIVIIDEISMVSKNLLEYIHGRLKQIKKTTDDEPFGNVSIIAVGDFFQLPPVKGKPLYKSDPSRGRDLWLDYFTIIELDEIMRQKGDSEFAELLNRLRIRCRSQSIATEDVELLKSREVSNNQGGVLHAFATNDEVNLHNKIMLESNGQEIITVPAQDFHKDPRSGKMVTCDSPYQTGNDYLPDNLQISLNSRVMLVRNIDIQDGLVNGATGTLVKIIALNTNKDKSLPTILCIKFDNPKVGLKAQQTQTPSIPSGAIGIEMFEEGLSIKYTVRRQFPIVLCWACTIHKTQGLTTDSICADFQKVSRAGMAYVVLSRSTSLQGLFIRNLQLNNIYCDENIRQALLNMKSFSLQQQEQTLEAIGRFDRFPEHSLALHIVYHNVQGLLQHKEDIEQGTTMLQADVLCVTETWLQQSIMPPFSDFVPYVKSRRESFEATHPVFRSFITQIHGGVGIFCSAKRQTAAIDIQVKNVECVGVLYEQSIAMFTMYRPSSYPVGLFCEQLNMFLTEIYAQGLEKIIIAGDFNENLMHRNQPICNTMKSNGYDQIVDFPTTDVNTIIDHVYIKGLSKDEILIKSQPTYFSFHNAIDIFISLTKLY